MIEVLIIGSVFAIGFFAGCVIVHFIESLIEK